MNNQLKYTKLTVYLKASRDVELPNYHGSMIRGVMGRTIREISCSKENEICENCNENNICPYTKIFYGINFTQNTKFDGIDKVPNSFIIEPLMNGTSYIKKGEFLKFNLTVLGSANEYLDYYMHAIYKIADRGLSKGNIKFTVDKITDEKGIIVADEKLIYFNKIKPVISELNTELNVKFKDIKDITIYYETPTRIKAQGKFVQSISFEVFIKNLLRRISLLFEYYSDESLNVDYKYLIEKSKNIQTYESNTKWVQLERFSGRTNEHVSIGGMTGKISYKGDLEEFLQYLEFGKTVHIGKGCVMGLGKYNVVVNE